MMSLYRISYAAPSVWNSLPCDINYIQSPTAFKAALKTLLFNPFTAWPRRFLGHTVHAICPGLENFQVIGKVYFQFCSCREATLAGIHMAARLTSHTFFLYGGLRAYFSTIFFGGWEWGWGGGGGDVISGSWLLIKESIVYILLHVKFWMRFWMMLVMMMKPCTTVKKGTVVVGRKKMVIFFQNNVVNEEWLSRSLIEWK